MEKYKSNGILSKSTHFYSVFCEAGAQRTGRHSPIYLTQGWNVFYDKPTKRTVHLPHGLDVFHDKPTTLKTVM